MHDLGVLAKFAIARLYGHFLEPRVSAKCYAMISIQVHTNLFGDAICARVAL